MALQSIEPFANLEAVAKCPSLQRFLDLVQFQVALVESPMAPSGLQLLCPTAADVFTAALNESSADAVRGFLMFVKRQDALITSEGLSWLSQQLWQAIWKVRGPLERLPLISGCSLSKHTNVPISIP